MSVIYIEKLNEASVRVSSDDFGVEQELSEYLSFRPKGYQFTPKYKERIWDGVVRMYSVHTKLLPRGLADYVAKFAEDNGYEIKRIDLDDDEPAPTLEEVQSFIAGLNLHSGGRKISMRDYQIEAVHQALVRKRMIVLSPTGSGKSAILYCIIRWLLVRGEKIMLAVPTTGLVTQMISDFKDYASETDWDVDEHVHGLFSGQEKVFTKPVLCTTWQSVHALSKKKTREVEEFYRSWAVYIGDEAHRFASQSLVQIANRMVNAKYRIGTTGTLQDEKVSKLALEGGFGPAYRVITTKELMDAGQVVGLKIKCLMLDYDDETKKLLKGADYQKELDFIVSNERRNNFIINLAKVSKGNTLILFNFIEKQGKPLLQLAKDKCAGRPIFYIAGEVKVEERERIRKVLNEHDDAIIICSYQTTSTGVNIPSIENVIFASPSKSKIRNLQSIGRGLRLREGKTHCNLFDIADNFTIKSKMNTTMRHFKERIETYQEEKFEFKIKQIKF